MGSRIQNLRAAYKQTYSASSKRAISSRLTSLQGSSIRIKVAGSRHSKEADKLPVMISIRSFLYSALTGGYIRDVGSVLSHGSTLISSLSATEKDSNAYLG